MIEEIVQPQPSAIVFQPFPKRKRFRNFSGETFGRLTVIGYLGSRQRSDGNGTRSWWMVKCECGTVKEVESNNLSRGDIRSCGCKQGGHGPKDARSYSKTGRNSVSGYVGWKGLFMRCYNPKHPAYQRYGGRGITVHPDWTGVGGFERFIAHIGPKPTPNHSIDRIDNNGNYDPGNVRWATRKEQGRNSRHNRLLTHNGITQPLVCWSEELGLRREVIADRINRGWPVADALSPITRAECCSGQVGKALPE